MSDTERSDPVLDALDDQIIDVRSWLDGDAKDGLRGSREAMRLYAVQCLDQARALIVLARSNAFSELGKHLEVAKILARGDQLE